MNIPVHILNRGVDNGVLEIIGQSLVGETLVGEDDRASLDLFTDLLLELFPASALDNSGTNFASTLDHPEHHGLVLAARVSDAFAGLRGVHVAGLAANEVFIDFNLASEMLPGWWNTESETNAMVQEPSCFLSHANGAVDFIAAYAILAIYNLPHRHKPFVQADWGIFHHSSHFDGELRLVMITTALPPTLICKEDDAQATTSGASDTVRPALSRQEVQAVVSIAEIYDCLLECFGFADAFQALILQEILRLVTYVVTLIKAAMDVYYGDGRSKDEGRFCEERMWSVSGKPNPLDAFRDVLIHNAGASDRLRLWALDESHPNEH